MNEEITVDRTDDRERCLTAFAGGGSVMIGGQIISRREDLPDDHPARWEEDEIARIEAAMESGASDSLMLSRVAELEIWLKQRDATIDALQATNDQQQAALEAMRGERDDAVESLKAFQTKEGTPSPSVAPGTATPPKPAERVAPPQSAPPVPEPVAEKAPSSVAPGPDFTPAPEATAQATTAATPLPLDFPKRSDLIAANFATVEALKAVPPGDLTQIAGIGPAAATAITQRLAAL